MKQQFVVNKEDVDAGRVQIVKVMSTSHITAKDDEILVQATDPHGKEDVGFIVRDMEEGWLINLDEYGSEEYKETMSMVRRTSRLSEDFQDLMRTASEQGYTHLRLDPDGPVDLRVKHFNW